MRHAYADGYAHPPVVAAPQQHDHAHVHRFVLIFFLSCLQAISFEPPDATIFFARLRLLILAFHIFFSFSAFDSHCPPG
jgi:hypothetical protein